MFPRGITITHFYQICTFDVYCLIKYILHCIWMHCTENYVLLEYHLVNRNYYTFLLFYVSINLYGALFVGEFHRSLISKTLHSEICYVMKNKEIPVYLKFFHQYCTVKKTIYSTKLVKAYFAS